MRTNITRTQTPEERELSRKRYELSELEEELAPTMQKSRMLQIQGVRGCSCSVLPQTLGNEGYAVYSAFPQGKNHANFIKILEFTRGGFQIVKSNFFEALRLLSFMPLCHVFYATLGLAQRWRGPYYHITRLLQPKEKILRLKSVVTQLNKL